MNGFTRRRFLTVSTAAIAASAAGGLLQSGQAEAAPLKYEPEKGATLRVLRWKRFVQGMKINCWRTRAGSPSSLASRCASIAKTSRICVPKRPWPRRWGRDPTSSSARTSNRSCIRTSWWMSASWRITLGRSTAAGSRSVRSTARTRVTGSRFPPV